MRLATRKAFGWPARPNVPSAPCRNGTVVHYDGSRQGLAGKDHSKCVAYWQNTRRFHMGGDRGWKDIGYSFGVCPHGWVFEGRGWGYSQAAQPGGNTTWTSVTFMSGEGEAPTKAQVTAYRELRIYLRNDKKMLAGEKRHADFTPTSCAGSILNEMVANGTLRNGAVDEEDDDMPSAKEVAEAVWGQDGMVPAPPSSSTIDTNPTWKAASHLTEINERQRQTQAMVATILAQMSNAVPADVDEAELAARLAPQIVAAMPDDLAQRVLDQLKERLEA